MRIYGHFVNKIIDLGGCSVTTKWNSHNSTLIIHILLTGVASCKTLSLIFPWVDIEGIWKDIWCNETQWCCRGTFFFLVPNKDPIQKQSQNISRAAARIHLKPTAAQNLTTSSTINLKWAWSSVPSLDVNSNCDSEVRKGNPWSIPWFTLGILQSV